MTKKELRKMEKEHRLFMNKIKEKEESLKLCRRPFSHAEAMSVYKEITSDGVSKHLFENRYDKNFDACVVSYSSGKYTVTSVYDIALNRYTTLITYKPKTFSGQYADRPMRNAQLQHALHVYGQTIRG